ncbi:zinc finger protein 501 [Ixodes scapularis]
MDSDLIEHGDGGAYSKEIGYLPETTTDILFKCCFCTCVTGDQHGIVHHLVFHSDEQQAKYQPCPESISMVEDLGDQTEIHKPERTFESHLCPTTFQKNTQLVDHIRMHEGSRKRRFDGDAAEFGDFE